MKPLKSPHRRVRIAKSGNRIANGRKMAHECHKWMESHEADFFDIYSFIKSLQATEKVGRVRDRVAVYAMQKGIKVGNDPNFKFANAYWAGIARYLALYDPSLLDAPLILHDSDIDCYGLVPVSYLPIKERR